MGVDRSPKEIVRLWPKLPVAALPANGIDRSPVTPITLVASATTAVASCAAAAVLQITAASAPSTSAFTPFSVPPRRAERIHRADVGPWSASDPEPRPG